MKKIAMVAAALSAMIEPAMPLFAPFVVIAVIAAFCGAVFWVFRLVVLAIAPSAPVGLLFFAFCIIGGLTSMHYSRPRR